MLINGFLGASVRSINPGMPGVNIFCETAQSAQCHARGFQPHRGWATQFARGHSSGASLRPFLLALLVLASAFVLPSRADGPVAPRSGNQAAAADPSRPFPAEREIQLPKVPALSGPAPKLQGTLIVRAKGDDFELFLGADRCTMEELPKKLAELLTPKGRAERGDFSPSGRGGGPVLALAIDRNVPCASVFDVLRAVYRAGFERLWVKCDDPDDASARQRPNGFLLEWLVKDESVSPRVPVVVDITQGGEFYVNGSKYSPQKLERSLKEVRDADPYDIVVARPRDATPFEKLAAVWQVIARSQLMLVDPEGTFAPTLPKPPQGEPPK